MSSKGNSTLGDACMITTEEGAGIDEDVKKLKAISLTVNDKLA
jgi:hypothetical protein